MFRLPVQVRQGRYARQLFKCVKQGRRDSHQATSVLADSVLADSVTNLKQQLASCKLLQDLLWDE
jgi:hypothetical protein